MLSKRLVSTKPITEFYIRVSNFAFFVYLIYRMTEEGNCVNMIYFL